MATELTGGDPMIANSSESRWPTASSRRSRRAGRFGAVETATLATADERETLIRDGNPSRTAPRFGRTEVKGPRTLSASTMLPRTTATEGEEFFEEDVDALLPEVYSELVELARKFLRGERAGHTLQPTALVHETYLKLSNHRNLRWNDPQHFVAIAARAMRQILVNYAESRNAAKRGGNWGRVELDQVVSLFHVQGVDVVALNEALEQLQELDPLQAKIVELRFFGGLSMDEVADAVDTPQRTVEREWAMARAWLRCRLSETAGDKIPA